MTTPHHPSFDPATEDAAALWAAKLDGSVLTAAERRELEAWLAAAPGRRALLSSYCQLSTDLEQQVPLLEGLRDLPVEESSAPVTARPSPWSLRPLWVGAMLTAAAAVALVLWVGRTPRPETLAFSTADAQRQTVTLADGSRLELNAHTQLTAALAADARRVRLARGQAFFAVASDARRPFFVETAAGTVRVTGTKFDVRADELAPLQVTVLEGSVEVQPAGAAQPPFVLGVGDQYAGGAVRALHASEVDAVLAWRDGEIVFRGAQLREVLAAFARHHGRTLTATPAAGEQRFGGRFNLDDLEGFLNGLENSDRGLEVQRDANGTVQIRLRSEKP